MSQANDAKCKANKDKIGLLQVNANAPFNDTAIILHTTHKHCKYMNNIKKWVNYPNKMLESNLLQALEQNCFQVAISPFGTQKLNKILKLSLLGLQVSRE